MQLGGNFLVFEGNDARERFEECDLGAERTEDGGEFHAHRAAADHDHRFRDLLQAENFAIGEHHVPSISTPGSERAAEPVATRMFVGFELGGLAVFFHGDAAWSGDSSPAGDGFDFVFLEEHGDAAGVFFYDLVFARENGGPIDFYVRSLRSRILRRA